MILNFSKRINQLEIIDGTHYSETEYIEWLHQLRRVNLLTQGYAITIQGLNKLLRNVSSDSEVRVVDIGCGGGDTLLEILKWSRQNNYKLHIVGVDKNSSGLKFAAKKLQQQNLTAELFLGDGLEYIKTHPVDIVLSSLFTHHLNDLQILTLLRNIASNCKLGFIINDLHRHWLPYFIMLSTTKLPTTNRLLKYDGPLSVARAFKKKEWQHYFLQAEIPLNKIEISWHWSFRYSILFNAR